MLARFSALALALTSTVVAAEAPLPSLRLGFQLKRSTMAVYGSTTFDVYASPVVSADDGNSTVSFDAKVSFTQDETTHNFVLVGDAAYHEVVNASATATSCLPSEMLPNVTAILAALASAEPVSTVDTTQDISCASGKWLTTTLEGDTFVVCEDADENGSFEVFGEDIDITVSYLNETVDISVPATAPTNCVETYGAVDNSVELSDIRLLWGASVYSDSVSTSGEGRKLRQSVSLASSTCSCQSTPRPCLFFHGMDVAADGGLVDSYSFFGDIKEHAPCCSSFHFAILNTDDYEWYNDTLQQKACDMALNVSAISTGETNTTVIQDTIIVAHSMGNNMFAGAVATGKCSIGSGVDWVDLAGPLKGSMGSDFLHEVCDSGNEIVTDIATLIGQCPGTTTRRSLVWDGGEYCSAEESALYASARAVHEKYVTASMCGTQYSGLLSSEYLSYFFGGLILPHHTSKNDGVVEFPSCIGNLDSSKFAADYSSAFYAAALNHGDMAFHNGEGLLSSAKKPLKWFECLL